ncbi:heme ABC transporter [Pasteurellaceae bacterium LFhippo2]|nr:heme ABC transporter [Pasteurellaceae bacterium LFhippo2]
MISIQNLSLNYCLKDINLQIPSHKLIGIMGANGAGKSTLLKAIAGILPLTTGQIWLENCKLSALNPKQKSEQLAYLAQNTQIHWDLTSYDVIALGLPAPLKKSEEQQKIQQVAEKFSIQHLLNHPFQQLSGGEKARVQLARCCIKQSPLLLVDEPIATLDPYYQIDIMQQLKSLTPAQTCIVVIHHLDLAYRFCDEVILLNNGKVLASGKTEQVLTAENLAEAFGIQAQIDIEQRHISKIEKLNSH